MSIAVVIGNIAVRKLFVSISPIDFVCASGINGESFFTSTSSRYSCFGFERVFLCHGFSNNLSSCQKWISFHFELGAIPVETRAPHQRKGPNRRKYNCKFPHFNHFLSFGTVPTTVVSVKAVLSSSGLKMATAFCSPHH